MSRQGAPRGRSVPYARRAAPAALLLGLLACHPQPDSPAGEDPVDTAPVDTGTREPCCGDGATNGDEGCDDSNLHGGDGCSSTCTVEDGAIEHEPNDTYESPNDEATGMELDGWLPPDDVDCWRFQIGSCDAVTVTQAEPCTSALVLSLYTEDGASLANGAIEPSGCVSIEPAEQPGARWVTGGGYVACVSAVAGALVPDYALMVTTGPSDTTWPVSGEDLDSDGRPVTCDDDDDGDGILDGDDTCPDLSNGPDSGPLAVDTSGFVLDWLTAGPFDTGTSADTCRPSDTALVGEDGVLMPLLGDPAGDVTWVAALGSPEALDFNPRYGTIDAPREAYAFVYLTSPTARTLTLAVGADDGMFAWWNGVKVIEESSCQGIYADQFQADVDVLAGVNTLLLKVYDQGGGWGLAARLLDAGTAVVDLTPSLSSDPAWRPDQTDSDGDGVGDVCE